MTPIRSHRLPVPAGRNLTTVAIAAMLAVVGASAHAQSAAAAAAPASAASSPTQEGAQTVTVTGVRAAVETAQALKRDSDKVSDSIVADDIGKFPDENVANALARVTGVQIRRDSGEASSVLIRGLPNVETLLNGREVFTTTGRYISLADVPVTMVSRVDVLKSSTPDVPEGGIAGVIDVRTHRPFDFTGLQASVSVKDMYADKAKDWNPNISGMISNRWQTPIGEVGVLLGLSALDDKYHEERAFDTAPVNKSWLLAPAGDTSLYTGVDEVGLISINGERKRTAGNFAVEWKPNAASSFYLEGLRTRLINTWETDFFVGLPWWNSVSVPNGGLNGWTGTLVPGTRTMATLTTFRVNTIDSTQANTADSKTAQYALGGHYDVAPEWRVSGEVAMTNSTYLWRNPILDTITSVPEAQITVNQGGSMHLSYTGEDLTNPSNFYLKGFFDRYGEDKGLSRDLRADVSYTPSADGWLKEWNSGVRASRHYATSIKSFEGNHESQYYDSTKDFPWTQSVNAVAGLNCVTKGMTDNYGLQKWYTPCASTLLNNTSAIRLAITGSADPKGLDPGSFFSDHENNAALYTEAKVGWDIGKVAVSGTVGARLVHTQQKLQGNGSVTDTSNNTTYSAIDRDESQNMVLPSLNFKFDLTPQLVGRFAAGRTLTRPNFADLNPGVALVNQSETVQATGSGGNPDLKAETGDNLEAALEWYFAKAGSLTATTFFHHFNGYIEYTSKDESYSGTSYLVTRPYNTSSGNLSGVEVGYQQFYDSLPSFLSGFGVGANATLMNGTATTITGQVRPITGVSKFSYNLALLYEKYGLSGRVAYNWRSKFTDTYDAATDYNGKSLDLVVAPMAQLDASLMYHVTPKLSVTLDATNLLNFKYHDYWSNASLYPRDTRRYDRTGTIGLNWSL